MAPMILCAWKLFKIIGWFNILSLSNINGDLLPRKNAQRGNAQRGPLPAITMLLSVIVVLLILREVEMSNFFLVIFTGLLLLVFVVALNAIRLIPSNVTIIIGLVVLISFLVYLIDFMRVGKHKRILRRHVSRGGR